MKSKTLLYLLALLVLCIWGVIIYRIYLSVHDEGADDGEMASATVVKKIKVPKLYPDTFKLMLDYPDPFTGEAIKAPDTVRRRTLVKEQPGPAVAAVPVIDPVSQMKYLGFVSDDKGANRVAIIGYQGSEKMLKEGDTLSKVKIINIGKEAVRVGYASKTRLLKTE
jgi:hypothetical protein